MPARLRPLTGRGTHPQGLPVVLPFRLPRVHGRLHAWHGVALAAVFVTFLLAAEARAAPADPSILQDVLKWAPLVLRGFAFNLVISVLAMAIGTAAGGLLGLGQVSARAPVRKGSWLVTQFFRNAPWLVLLFYCILLLPYQFTLFGEEYPLPAWVKAVFGLSLPVMANVSEIVRGGVQSIPSAQWEAAESLAFNRRQTMWMIILPQCVKRMLPPWMNLYAILTMATPLVSIVGVDDAMKLTGEALASEERSELLIPMYVFLLGLFFIYCYPIARLTARLERRFAVAG